MPATVPAGDDLTAFIQARLSEDEAAAEAATPGPWKAETYIDENEPVGVEYLVSAPAEAHIVAGAGLGHDQAEAETIHIARHDPARVLRDVTAKRAILAEYLNAAAEAERFPQGAAVAVRDAMLLFAIYPLAAVWADHLDYRDEWKPWPPNRSSSRVTTRR